MAHARPLENGKDYECIAQVMYLVMDWKSMRCEIERGNEEEWDGEGERESGKEREKRRVWDGKRERDEDTERKREERENERMA